METPLSSLTRPISPPQSCGNKKRIRARDKSSGNPHSLPKSSKSAAIEAGKTRIRDHLTYFSNHLSSYRYPDTRLSIADYTSLYQSHQHARGHHFVIHQHNHPIAGCHYDLRLQFSETSACSFAIPYGVPGNPNSKRQGRLAVETRVHNVWNNLIESASTTTGSLLIWDTGSYEVLARKKIREGRMTDDEDGEHDRVAKDATSSSIESQNRKLIRAFQSRFMRLRLHGTRLPQGYTITLRLPTANNTIKLPSATTRPRKAEKRKRQQKALPASSEDEAEAQETEDSSIDISEIGQASDAESEAEASTIRKTNAYTGATNSIGSIHQRHWFMSLDRASSGFVRSKGERELWVPANSNQGFEPFFVMGTEVERSIATGRTSDEVFKDEGVEGFRPRKMWRPVLE